MRVILGIFAGLLINGCGGGSDGEDTEPASEDLGISQHALTTSPWEYLFAVRGSGSWFALNPLGTEGITCLDGSYASECTVSRLNLARDSGLTTSRQQLVMNRVALEPADESQASVIVKGVFVRVRDRRVDPPLQYDEFRASAVYLASSIRAHAATFLYVASAPVNGMRTVRSTNSMLLPRGISIPFAARLRWVGPGAAPSSYPVDSLVSAAAWRLISVSTEGLGSGPFEFDVDQRFLRLTNYPSVLEARPLSQPRGVAAGDGVHPGSEHWMNAP